MNFKIERLVVNKANTKKLILYHFLKIVAINLTLKDISFDNFLKFDVKFRIPFNLRNYE